MSAEAVSLKEIAFGDLERELGVTRRGVGGAAGGEVWVDAA